MFFDTHAHVNDKRFDEDRETFINSLSENNIYAFTEVAYDMKSSYGAVELAEKYDRVYAAVGTHPADCDTMTEDALEELRTLCAHDKVVALGEIGLDYYYDDNPHRDVQREWFEKQINLAKDIDIPIIVHSRDAMEDTINILKATNACDGIIHCFSGSVESAKILLDMGFYISIAGPVTFKNARGLLDVARCIPIDRLLIETDSPYLTPEPYRGKRNCPVYVRYVCEKIAQLRNMSVEELAQITKNNAKTVYRLK